MLAQTEWCQECQKLTGGSCWQHTQRFTNVPQDNPQSNPWRPRKPYRCPVCNGRGYVPANFYSGLGSSAATYDERCRSCEGKGIVWDPA